MNEWIGTSVAMRCVRDAAERFAAHPAPLMLVGETGTGKSRLARYITACGPRADAPFVTFDGAVTERRALASDLRKAWTAAGNGTLFVDHIGEMPSGLQKCLAKLLSCHNKGPFGPRLLAANQARLERVVSLGRFSTALFARINRMAIHLPPLCKRLEDIPLLAEYFLSLAGRHCRRHGVSRAALDCLQAYPWPGNVRELNNVLHRAMILAGRRFTLQPRDIVYDGKSFAQQSAAQQPRVRPAATL